MLNNILGSNAFFIVNKKIVKNLGLETALIIGDLISKKQYFKDRGELQEDNSFYNTQENIKEDTGLSEHQQRKALKILVKEGFLKIIRRGVPAKNFYLINEEIILNYLIKDEKSTGNSQMLKNLTSRSKKIKHLDTENFNINNNKDNNNKVNNNKKSIINDREEKRDDIDFDIINFLEENKLNTIKNKNSVKKLLNKNMSVKEILKYLKELYENIIENKDVKNPKGLFSSKLEKQERQENSIKKKTVKKKEEKENKKGDEVKMDFEEVKKINEEAEEKFIKSQRERRATAEEIALAEKISKEKNMKFFKINSPIARTILKSEGLWNE